MQLAISVPANGLSLYAVVKIVQRYLQVGSLLHMIAIINFFVARFFYLHAIYQWHEGVTWIFFLNIYLMLFFGSIPFFAQLDAWSRWQNYKLFRDLLFKYGYRDRFAKSLMHSRCQREAAYIAALDVDLTDPVARFFYNRGYRWYHIIPDFVIKTPGYLLTDNFWKTTFFAKKYKVKYFPA